MLVALWGRRKVAGLASDTIDRRRVGWLGWVLRLFGGLALLAVLAFGALFAVYAFSVLPQEKAEQRREAAFARLTGPARRLAIYDTFVAQVDQHYYDQQFSGFDWPKLKREWRARAATARDDQLLYTDVFVQVAQTFPASHVTVFMAPDPPRGPAAPTQPAGAITPPCSPRDMGMQFVQIRRSRGVPYVVGEVWPGSPAAGAGVSPGWVVEPPWTITDSVDHGKFKAVFFTLEPAEMHRFEATVDLALPTSVRNPAQAQSFPDARRRRIELNYSCGAPDLPFETRRLAGGARYIRFDAFQPAVVDQVKAALGQADQHGVVLDLRSNPGGYPLLALNALLPPRQLVFFERDAKGLHPRSTDSSTRPYEGPLAVLIGPGSMSAAEITAAALKRAGRAILIGRRTNGSVLSSRTFALPDGGQVQLPVSDVLTPDRQRLEGVGVAPDIEVYPTATEIQAGRDPALERAEQALQAVPHGGR